jgi:AAHS family 4-hydroxybenzoate transporter-like MFS transporter
MRGSGGDIAPAADYLGDSRMAPGQIRVILLCAVIALLDGFDTQAIGFVAPVIASAWKLPLPIFGPVFAVGLVGGLLGAVLFGFVADRMGRRVTLLSTVALFATGTLLTITARTPLELGALRFVTGLGLGGAMPSMIALAAEYAPTSRRNTLVTAMFCGFPLGAVIGAVASVLLMATHGWEAVFLAGGIAPVVLLLALVMWLPESIGWLMANGRQDQAATILSRMGKAKSTLPQPTEQPPRPSLRNLFHGRLGIGTVLLALIFFVSLLLVFLLVSWIPAFAVQAGYSVRAGTLASAVLNLTGICGSLTIGALSDRNGAYRVVGTTYALGGALISVLALLSSPAGAIFPFCVIAGFLCIGSQMCAVSIASQFYPVALRGTGVGWAMGMGRFGGIAGPLIGATLVSSGAGSLFWLVASLSGAAAVGILLMGRLTQIPSKTAENND